jgi:hypothetical protein
MRRTGLIALLLSSFTVLGACESGTASSTASQRTSSTQYSTVPASVVRGSGGVDTAALERQFAAEQGQPYRTEKTTTYGFEALPFQIQTVRLVGHGVCALAYAIDSEGRTTLVYDSGYVFPACGEVDLDIVQVSLVNLDKRPLLVLDERKFGFACVGGSTREVVTAVFFDTTAGFRKVLALERSAFDFDDAEGRRGSRTWYRYADIYPNGCSDTCTYLSVFAIGSKGVGEPPFSLYGWNPEHTALVGLR